MDSFDIAGQGIILFVTLFTMMVGLFFTVLPPLPGTIIILAGGHRLRLDVGLGKSWAG